MERGKESYRRFLKGDDTGMEEIITDYRDGLIFYLYKLVGNLNLAEEIAEDTFVRLCIKKPKDKKDCSFKTWLYTIGRNLAIDELRRRSKIKVLSQDELEKSDLQGENLEENYIRDSEKIAVNRALKRLKSDYRQVLWLFYFEDLSYREIARIMKRSERATQMLASRARETLKTELLKEGIPYENNEGNH